MKVKELIIKLQALNPEAEVHIYSGGWESEPGELEAIYAAKPNSWGDVNSENPHRNPTKDDLFIMLECT
jgi:hypothetical protein